jgi:hypothetical protein
MKKLKGLLLALATAGLVGAGAAPAAVLVDSCQIIGCGGTTPAMAQPVGPCQGEEFGCDSHWMDYGV